MSDQYGNTVNGEIIVPTTEIPWDEAWYAGYRQGQSDEHNRWSQALDKLIEMRK